MKIRRVFALAPDCHVEGWRYRSVWTRHFYEGLASAGVEVVVPRHVSFDWARPLAAISSASSHHRQIAMARLREQIEACAGQGLDAVISYCFSQDVDLELVEYVRALGVPWVNFYCDSLHAFEHVEALARSTDLNWFVESEANADYERLGVPHLCAPYALNPTALPDATCDHPVRALSFVGTAHRDRIVTLVALRAMGVDFEVGGHGWDSLVAQRGRPFPRGFVRHMARRIARKALAGRLRGYFDDTELIDYLRGCQTLLGLSQSGGSLGLGRGYLKLRDIELPGMGCCYLVQHSVDVERAFDVGQEICTFRTLSEARSLARELAADPSRCRSLGLRARKRVLGSHSWAARLPQIEDALS